MVMQIKLIVVVVVEISIVGFGPATRGTESWPWLYSTTTAHMEISIVGFGPATRGTESWPLLYSTTTAPIEISVVSFGPATKLNKAKLKNVLLFLTSFKTNT